jgi:hypothetical protein
VLTQTTLMIGSSLPSLRTLSAPRCFSYNLLAQRTQLQQLRLPAPNDIRFASTPQQPSAPEEGPAVLSRLTCLTCLVFWRETRGFPSDFGLQRAWQSQLASALTALTGLRQLGLSGQIQERALADAINQLTAVTQLSLGGYQPTGFAFVLPSVQLLRLQTVDLGSSWPWLLLSCAQCRGCLRCMGASADQPSCSADSRFDWIVHSWTILATLSGRVCTCLPHSTRPLHMLLNATQVELSSSSVDKCNCRGVEGR